LAGAVKKEKPVLLILDLHGNALKKETAPDGSPDQNVFDIRQGGGHRLLRQAGRFSTGRAKRTVALRRAFRNPRKQSRLAARARPGRHRVEGVESGVAALLQGFRYDPDA